MTAALAPVRIGRDLLPGGRAVRLLAGLYFLASVAGYLLTAATGALSWPGIGQLALVFSLVAVGYTALVAALGDRLLVRVDPWMAAILLYGPLALILALPMVPGWAAAGASLYIGVSFAVEAVIGYGGCEIVGIPTLLLRRRYTVYCLFNSADVAERALQDRSRWAAAGLAVITFVLTAGVFEFGVSAIGHGSGLRSPWVAYLVFLVAGFVVNRILVARSARRVRPDPGGLALPGRNH
jgi:hypothetical protein